MAGADGNHALSTLLLRHCSRHVMPMHLSRTLRRRYITLTWPIEIFLPRMLCISAAYAVVRCLSVLLGVCHVHSSIHSFSVLTVCRNGQSCYGMRIGNRIPKLSNGTIFNDLDQISRSRQYLKVSVTGVFRGFSTTMRYINRHYLSIYKTHIRPTING